MRRTREEQIERAMEILRQNLLRESSFVENFTGRIVVHFSGGTPNGEIEIYRKFRVEQMIKE